MSSSSGVLKLHSNFDTSDEDKSLILSDKTRLHWLPKDYKLFFNKTTLIFGQPETGKTTIVNEFLYLLKDHIPNIFVWAPTNASNNTYTGKVPSRCIKAEMTVKGIEKLVTRQRNLAEVYQNSNNLEILSRLFSRVATEEERRVVLVVINRANLAIKANEKQTTDFTLRRSQKDEIENCRDRFLRKFYKKVIQKNKFVLQADPELTLEEKGAVEYLNLNPNMLIIFDDCAAQFKKMFKMTNAFKEIFFNIRWLNLTLIITTQDDKEIESELRKTSMVQIFTSSQIATANFDRSSNFYSKDMRQKAQKCIQTVFEQNALVPHYRKLVYVRGKNDPFRYMIADIHDNFKFGCPTLWELNDNYNKKSKPAIERNPFFKVFKGNAT